MEKVKKLDFVLDKGNSLGVDISDGFWAIASAEVMDSVGDVVKQDGMNWDSYHNPPVSYMKILAGHAKTLPDGTPPIVGRIEEFKKITKKIDGKNVKATAFRMSFAKDGEGNYTELALKYKKLYEGGYLDSFSVGLLVKSFEHNDTGMDINESELFEVSAVTVPCLASATVLRAIQKELDIPEEVIATALDDEIKDKVLHLTKTMDKQAEIISKQAEMLAEMAIKVDSITKSSITLEDSLKCVSNDYQKRLDTVNDRLDYVEAGVVVKSIVPTPTDDRKRVDAKELSEIANIFKKYSGRE